MPCADSKEAASKGKVKTEVAKSHQQKDDTHNDGCSPFCHCTCCAVFSINHLVASIIIVPLYESTIPTAYLPTNILDVALPVWQPPQLV